jgi:hypothetical protein
MTSLMGGGMKIPDKTVLVTGANRGIGCALVEANTTRRLDGVQLEFAKHGIGEYGGGERLPDILERARKVTIEQLVVWRARVTFAPPKPRAWEEGVGGVSRARL